MQGTKAVQSKHPDVVKPNVVKHQTAKATSKGHRDGSLPKEPARKSASTETPNALKLKTSEDIIDNPWDEIFLQKSEKHTVKDVKKKETVQPVKVKADKEADVQSPISPLKPAASKSSQTAKQETLKAVSPVVNSKKEEPKKDEEENSDAPTMFVKIAGPINPMLVPMEKHEFLLDDKTKSASDSKPSEAAADEFTAKEASSPPSDKEVKSVYLASYPTYLPFDC